MKNRQKDPPPPGRKPLLVLQYPRTMIKNDKNTQRGIFVTFHGIRFPAGILIINIRPVLLGHIRM